MSDLAVKVDESMSDVQVQVRRGNEGGEGKNVVFRVHWPRKRISRTVTTQSCNQEDHTASNGVLPRENIHTIV